MIVNVQYEQTEFYTVKQLAQKWSVSERVVQKWITEGAFPNAYKVGLGKRSPYRVPVSDVEDFERKRLVRQ